MAEQMVHLMSQEAEKKEGQTEFPKSPVVAGAPNTLGLSIGPTS
jgi:hypothetical protein